MILSAGFKSSIKRVAKVFGMLNLANRVEYLYGNRISTRTLEFYRRFIPPGTLCFDIGSHYGLKTELFLRLGAKVVSVEPNPDCCAFLHKKFDRDQRVVLVEGACGAAMGSGELQVFELNPQYSTVLKDHPHAAEMQEKTRTQPINIFTIDSLIAKHGRPTFCKIDTEGFEVQTLQGLHEPIATVSFEFHSGHLDAVEICLRHLQSLGSYQFNFCVERDLHFSSAKWLEIAELTQALAKLPLDCSGDIYCVLQ